MDRPTAEQPSISVVETNRKESRAAKESNTSPRIDERARDITLKGKKKTNLSSGGVSRIKEVNMPRGMNHRRK